MNSNDKILSINEKDIDDMINDLSVKIERLIKQTNELQQVIVNNEKKILTYSSSIETLKIIKNFAVNYDKDNEDNEESSDSDINSEENATE